MLEENYWILNQLLYISLNSSSVIYIKRETEIKGIGNLKNFSKALESATVEFQVCSV